ELATGPLRVLVDELEILQLVTLPAPDRAHPDLMRAQIEVGAIGDALELAPAERKQIFDVGGRLRIVRELLFFVRAKAELVHLDAERRVPLLTLLDPILEPLI